MKSGGATVGMIFRPDVRKSHDFRPRQLIRDLGDHILRGMQFTTPTVFQETIVPRKSELVGWAALVHAHGIQAPVRRLSCVSHGSIKGGSRQENAWTIFDKRTAPAAGLAGHLTFALRHETLDLLILKRLFDIVGPAEMARVVRSETVGATSRRLWFLYEWLTGRDLDLPDAEKASYVPILAPEDYVTARPVNSPRHQVRNNLLGTPAFCPIIRRTPALADFIGRRWDTQAKELVGRISKSVIARAASFLLLADSQASYQIEGERPPRNRLERWMRAVNQSGRYPLSIDELIRLQHIVVETGRFVTPGLRTEGGFIGPRDGLNDPLPEFVSARPEDVPNLLAGILDTSRRLAGDDVDAVLHATMIAFGVVFVHPFEDGNGRIHRYLIHHALAERGYTPPGIVFPVSSVILDRIESPTQKELSGFRGL
ncbi:Fic family protein [Phaeospirillum tilakii]|uniref:Fic family protein n=1 Tax=Phaeospirillum tilakii TaxID=741673 RepID=A0ABW5CEM9_9PROT